MFFKFFLCKYGYKAVSRRIFPFYVEFCGQILTIIINPLNWNWSLVECVSN